MFKNQNSSDFENISLSKPKNFKPLNIFEPCTFSRYPSQPHRGDALFRHVKRAPRKSSVSKRRKNLSAPSPARAALPPPSDPPTVLSLPFFITSFRSSPPWQQRKSRVSLSDSEVSCTAGVRQEGFGLSAVFTSTRTWWSKEVPGLGLAGVGGRAAETHSRTCPRGSREIRAR